MHKLLEYEGVKAKGIPHSKTQLWRKWKAGEFPAPVKIGCRNCWLESEIDAWIAGRIAARDGAA
jgi:predicted DNA-binding transcriptional regulator AlpA